MLVDSSVRRALGITLLKGLEHTFQLQKYKNSVKVGSITFNSVLLKAFAPTNYFPAPTIHTRHQLC